MTQPEEKPRREAGILLHPTSLPGPHGMGDLGAIARHFIDWLTQAGLGIWQVLPLGPTGNNCPYVCWSAFAGNPLLVDLAGLKDEGLLGAEDLRHDFVPSSLVDYDAVRAFKEPRLERAAKELLAQADHPLRAPLRAFREAEAAWVDDAALFWVVKQTHGGKAWWDWAPALRDRDPAALAKLRDEHASDIDVVATILFFFEHQWSKLRAYAHRAGVRIVGDLPIYVDRDSVDVWSHRSLFHLDEQGTPHGVSGVPPDYFSETGQLWGNPLYRWDRMADDDFAWWRARLHRVLAHTDVVRIDHFRAFAAYWEVPFGAPDARGGRWVTGPGIAFFEAIERHGGKLPLVAEDLGIIDDAVVELRRAAGLPGMRVLQFAFGGDADNTHLPHNHEPDNVVYPGTHDNDTTVGFWLAAAPHVRHHVQRYLRVSGHEVAWDFIHVAFASVARTAILPMQDVLSLGTDARMNNPATTRGNWRFRLHGADAFRRETALHLREIAELYGRLARRPDPKGAAK
jgi:4-alpha-glucanotransferase